MALLAQFVGQPRQQPGTHQEPPIPPGPPQLKETRTQTEAMNRLDQLAPFHVQQRLHDTSGSAREAGDVVEYHCSDWFWFARHLVLGLSHRASCSAADGSFRAQRLERWLNQQL